MNSEAMPEAMDAVAHALADRTRRRLLRLVRDDELTAGALAEACTHMSRPAVSQHLRVLHSAGLVSIRPDGNRRYYRARTEGLADVWQFIDDMWSDRLAKLKAVAERAEGAIPAGTPPPHSDHQTQPTTSTHPRDGGPHEPDLD